MFGDYVVFQNGEKLLQVTQVCRLGQTYNTSLPRHLLIFWVNDLEIRFKFFIHGVFKEKVVSITLSSMGPGGLEVFIYSEVGMKEAAWQW